MCIVNTLFGISLVTVGKIVAWASGILVSLGLATYLLAVLGMENRPLFTTSSIAIGLAVVFGLTHSVLLLVCCGLLFYGAVHKSPWYVLPWLVLTAIELIFRVISCIARIFEPKFNYIVILDCVFIGVLIGIWFLILSLFLKLRQHRRSTSPSVE